MNRLKLFWKNSLIFVGICDIILRIKNILKFYAPFGEIKHVDSNGISGQKIIDHMDIDLERTDIYLH